jgi:hypothetical protein
LQGRGTKIVLFTINLSVKGADTTDAVDRYLPQAGLATFGNEATEKRTSRSRPCRFGGSKKV